MPIYNRHTTFNKRGKPPIIRIDASGRNARITFSVEAVRLLHLKENDCLTFITLDKDREIIYFDIDNINGIEITIEAGFKTGVRAGVYCRPLARELAEHFKINGCRSFVINGERIPYGGKSWHFIDKHKPYAGRYKPNSKII